MNSEQPMTFDLPTLRAFYAAGGDPVAVIEAVYAAITAWNDPACFIHLRPRDEVIAAVRADRGSRERPLFGIPFAIKDNIDLAGVPTTAGCPSFAYVPERSATVVERLCAAGAIPIGKTNLDQFATGLVGTRSPYGTPRNACSAAHVPGGSSSGSASAVAAGLVSFAFGTDTAGSGRVPAACQNLVGLKPTRGWLSTRGVVPAARTCDCVSIFALTCADAWTVAACASGFDVEDPYCRRLVAPGGGVRRIGILLEADEQFDHEDDRRCYRAVCARLIELGYRTVPIDTAPLREAAALLYGGAFVAERAHAVGAFLATDPAGADAVVAGIVAGGTAPTAVDLVADQHRLAVLRRQAERIWADCDALCLPTTPGIATLAEVAADPVGRNRRLGTYTNWMNLLDCCGLAVPAGWRADGLPVGITLAAPAWADAALADVGGSLHAQIGGNTGHTSVPVPAATLLTPAPTTVDVVVIGAHLTGMPLNGQLISAGACLLAATETAPSYRLYALTDTVPAKPGMVRVAQDGVAIPCEVWRMPLATYGAFVATIPAPLGIGRIELSDGTTAQGFLCEAWAVSNATDISAYGGWRAYCLERAARARG